MMKKHSQHRSKLRSLFDPDSIVTEIHRALGRDFMKAQHEYCLNDSFTLYAFNRQVSEFRKKFCDQDQDKETLEGETFAKFLQINAHMAETNTRLKLMTERLKSTFRPADAEGWDKTHLRARAIVRSVLGPHFEDDEWFQECRNSQGSSIGVSFIDTSDEKKFVFPLSVTEKAKPYFQSCMAFDEELKAAVIELNHCDSPVKDVYKTEEGSRATTVDKTTLKRRMICVEPTCNMYLQQGLMHMMYKRMKAVGLDVETLPDLHRQLAKESSITGRNATIDWSSASDCVSTELLRHLLPPHWFKVIDQTRSHVTTIDGQNVRLNMISTMGNAVTFPLETLVFWAYAHATRLTKFGNTNRVFPEIRDYPLCSVFGDDCIVPSNIASEFIGVMEEVGFIINDEKSFYGSEQFRESCGGDYLAGYDVRPYSCKAPRSTKLSNLEPWLYIITNAFLKKYMTYFGKLSYVYDRELFRTLFELFRRHNLEIKMVPSFFPDDAGLKISHDIERFLNHYPIKLRRIAKSHQGTLSFSYCRFIYKRKVEKHGHLQYALWLKKPVQSPTMLFHEKDRVKNPLRKIGGYVVAKGISCHWHVPTVRSSAS